MLQVPDEDLQAATGSPTGSAPTLTAAGASAGTGDANTPFTFSATYSDAENEAPFEVDVVVDGVIHHMAPVNPNDTTYNDSDNVYTYTTTLARGTHIDGAQPIHPDLGSLRRDSATAMA